MIRRSTSSALDVDGAGEKLPMDSMMPMHKVQTVELVYREEEAIESQFVHRLYAR